MENASAAGLDVAHILDTLPHRFPFLFVDNVRSITPRKSAVVEKCVTWRECGELAGRRVFPPEFIVEMFGQAAILLFFADTAKTSQSVSTLLVGVESFEVLGFAAAGDCIEAEVVLEKLVSNAAIVSGRARVNGTPIAEGRLSAAFVARTAEVGNGRGSEIVS